MALATTYSTSLEGIRARIVSVESHVGPGLPGINIVGLGDAAVKESKFRLRTAASNSGLDWPKSKIVVSLSPADVPKRGSHLDLAVCLSVLATRHPVAGARLRSAVILGELALDGRVRPVTGILPSVVEAAKMGFSTVIIPVGSNEECGLIEGVRVLEVSTLEQAWEWALGGQLPLASTDTSGTPPQSVDFADIAGQPEAKYAAEIAAAGGHHMFLIGPPGSGKSMLAERMPTIFPPLTQAQHIEVAAIRSVMGLDALGTQAPFANPHHTVTRAGLIGGGSGIPQPGAITLAHHGVLFLDEASEVQAVVLDSLRTPLERGAVTHTRGHRSITFPACFQLILAANPCRCGAETVQECTCSVAHRRNYLNNISGPLRDRIDITVETVSAGARVISKEAETSAVIAQRVMQARQRSQHRWDKHGLQTALNRDVPGPYLRRHAPADDTAMALLEAHLAAGDLTQRGVDRALRLAWTIADLETVSVPNLDHVARAVDLRGTGINLDSHFQEDAA